MKRQESYIWSVHSRTINVNKGKTKTYLTFRSLWRIPNELKALIRETTANTRNDEIWHGRQKQRWWMIKNLEKDIHIWECNQVEKETMVHILIKKQNQIGHSEIMVEDNVELEQSEVELGLPLTKKENKYTLKTTKIITNNLDLEVCTYYLVIRQINNRKNSLIK